MNKLQELEAQLGLDQEETERYRELMIGFGVMAGEYIRSDNLAYFANAVDGTIYEFSAIQQLGADKIKEMDLLT